METCPSGYYHNNLKFECTKCSSKCETCTGPDESDCIKCANNLFLLESTCV